MCPLGSRTDDEDHFKSCNMGSSAQQLMPPFTFKIYEDVSFFHQSFRAFSSRGPQDSTQGPPCRPGYQPRGISGGRSHHQPHLQQDSRKQSILPQESLRVGCSIPSIRAASNWFCIVASTSKKAFGSTRHERDLAGD
jgi:hypothetical protein